ncbi:MAG: hypothetical protein F4025_10205, partial [Synechococcus sp. SB0669_bin_7]|nr:hypothetical protein [Synechococcus sp. SB0669_bin_7]
MQAPQKGRPDSLHHHPLPDPCRPGRCREQRLRCRCLESLGPMLEDVAQGRLATLDLQLRPTGIIRFRRAEERARLLHPVLEHHQRRPQQGC